MSSHGFLDKEKCALQSELVKFHLPENQTAIYIRNVIMHTSNNIKTETQISKITMY